MNLRAGAMGLLAALAVLVTVCAPVLADVDDRPIVVIREDDCRSSLRTVLAGLGGVNALTYAKQKRIPITWGVITNLAGASDPSSLSWPELIDYRNVAGGEFASHSCSHTSMPDTQSYVNEVYYSKLAIEARVSGYKCNTFIQPGTWTNDAYVNRFAKLDNPIGLAIQSTYQQSQAYLAGKWMVGPVYYRYGLAVSYTLDATTDTSSRSLALLDIVAQTPGLLYVVTFHGVQETGGTAPYAAQANAFRGYMDKLADLRDQGRVRLMTMDDAYHAVLSTNLNLVSDPGFELSKPEFGSDGPWQTNQCSLYKDSGGVSSSRYAVVTGWSLNGGLSLSPGRYRMSWSQKPEAGTPSSSRLAAGLLSYTPDNVRYDRLSLPDFANTDRNAWERRSALFKMEYGLAYGLMQFALRGNGGYGIDNVSILAEPLDPSVSPSGSRADITPAALDVSWDTPNDPTITSVCVRSDPKFHPESPTQGSALGAVPAQPGTRQHLLVGSPNWATQSYMFISVFAVRSGGSYSPPDLVDIRVDKAAPNTPAVSVSTAPNRTVSAAWSSSDPDLQSGVSSFQYAVGTQYGRDDVIHWTSSSDTSVTLTVPSSSSRILYFLVRARNFYGYWSPAGSAQFTLGVQMPADGVWSPDGATVTVTGTVSAVFGDCIYVEDESRTRGLRILGTSGYCEGDLVTITGVLSTVNGERMVTAAGM